MDNGRCVAILNSMTQAMKAERVLSAAAIPSRVIKTEAASSLRGCTYGIEFNCNQINNVRWALSSGGVAVKKWSGED